MVSANKSTNLESKKKHIDQFGYCIIEKAINTSTVTALRKRLLEQKKAEEQLGHKREQAATSEVQLIKFLINKGSGFRDLLFHNLVRELVDYVLGSTYLLSSFNGHIAQPGAKPIYHTDQWWMPPPTNDKKETFLRPGDINKTYRGHHLTGETGSDPISISPAVVCNCLWLLDDFTTENGGTIFVPGSHLLGRQPDADADRDAGWISAKAPSGSVIVLDGRIWHSGGKNITGNTRMFLTSNFCAPQFRQQENLQLGTSEEVIATASQELLALLGFQPFCGYGSIEAYGERSREEGMIERGQYGLGELKSNEHTD